MGNAINPHIEHAEKTGVCNLGKQGLTEFPEVLLRLSGNLRTLDLSENKLAALPPQMGNYGQLKSLNVSSNRLAALPEELGNTKKLETLNASMNRLTSLPKSLSALTSLRDVSLSHNNLKSFPVVFSGLKGLASLDLSHNKIAEVPDQVQGLQVIELNLNQNQIGHMSAAVGLCPKLKVLRVEENCLELRTFTPSLLKDSRISLFAVEGNVFDMKAFNQLDGYDEYMERFTATRKKFS